MVTTREPTPVPVNQKILPPERSARPVFVRGAVATRPAGRVTNPFTADPAAVAEPDAMADGEARCSTFVVIVAERVPVVVNAKKYEQPMRRGRVSDPFADIPGGFAGGEG